MNPAIRGPHTVNLKGFRLDPKHRNQDVNVKLIIRMKQRLFNILFALAGIAYTAFYLSPIWFAFTGG